MIVYEKKSLYLFFKHQNLSELKVLKDLKDNWLFKYKSELGIVPLACGSVLFALVLHSSAMKEANRFLPRHCLFSISAKFHSVPDTRDFVKPLDDVESK